MYEAPPPNRLPRQTFAQELKGFLVAFLISFLIVSALAGVFLLALLSLR